jgi:hypothetical protein
VDPVPPIAPLPFTLDYDELPRGSDLRREFAPGGAVKIVAPAGEPPRAVLLAASQAAMVWAAGLSAGAVLLGVLAVASAADLRRLDTWARWSSAGLLAVLCGGVFLLIWRVRYAGRADALHEARGQSTILHADSARLLVETAGPYGSASYDLPAAQIRQFHVRPGRPRDDGGPARHVLHLDVERAAGPPLRLLPGRDEAELRWVARTLSRVLGVPQDQPGSASWHLAERAADGAG